MKRLWNVLGALIMSAAIAGGGYLYFDHQMSSPLSSKKTAVEITIQQGATYDATIQKLSARGLVPHPLLFQLRARIRGRRVPLKAGLFRFASSMSADQIMDKLADGPDLLLKDLPLKFQIAPGQNVFQVHERLVHLRAKGDLLKLAKNVKNARALGATLPALLRAGTHTALEGYLFPDTYFLNRKRPSVKAAAKRAVGRFKQVWSALKKKHRGTLASIRSELALSDHDLVTLASIVEKEIGVKDEAPLIAGVFYNRLRNGQRLQTDPTLVYGPLTWKHRPTPAHRRDRRNPYNTYHIPGLPPGPISNPGRAALEAVLAPEATNAFYFVARRDSSGRHAFARTLAQHRANIKRYLRR